MATVEGEEVSNGIVSSCIGIVRGMDISAGKSRYSIQIDTRSLRNASWPVINMRVPYHLHNCQPTHSRQIVPLLLGPGIP